PHRWKSRRGVVKEGAVAIAVVLELLPEGGAKAQQHFDHRPGREMGQRGVLGREWWRKAYRARRPHRFLQDAERERNDRALGPGGESAPSQVPWISTPPRCHCAWRTTVCNWSVTRLPRSSAVKAASNGP